MAFQLWMQWHATFRPCSTGIVRRNTPAILCNQSITFLPRSGDVGGGNVGLDGVFATAGGFVGPGVREAVYTTVHPHSPLPRFTPVLNFRQSERARRRELYHGPARPRRNLGSQRRYRNVPLYLHRAKVPVAYTMHVTRGITRDLVSKQGWMSVGHPYVNRRCPNDILRPTLKPTRKHHDHHHLNHSRRAG